VPDVDTRVIHDGLVSHPRFSDTLSWWTGPWVAGPGVPFYRPVPSTLFWLEWRAFGDIEVRYSVVNLVVHVLVAVLLFITCGRLFSFLALPHPEVAVFAAISCFFNGWFGLDPTRAVADESIAFVWKNLPDGLCALFSLMALYFYVRAIEARRRTWMGASVASFLLACSSKEAGSLLPVAFVTLEAARASRGAGRDASPTSRMAIWVVCIVLFQAFRLVVLGGIGFRYGSNREWPLRLISDVMAPIGPLLTIGNRLPLITAASAWLAYLVARALRIGHSGSYVVLVFVCTWAASLALVCWFAVFTPFNGDPWWVALAACTWTALDQSWWLVFLIVVFPLVIARGMRDAANCVALGYAWVIITAIPNAASPGPLHRQYLVGIGFCIAFAPGISSLSVDLVRRLRSLARTIAGDKVDVQLVDEGIVPAGSAGACTTAL